MPYIPQDQREYPGNFSVGYLNYAITKLCLEYLDAWGESYTRHNDIMGVLSAVQHEWYRRLTAAYEDKKRAENGDVYPQGGK